MAFDSAEKRFSAIHLSKRSGLPVPSGSITPEKRLHMIGLFSTMSLVPVPVISWRNRSLAAGSWIQKTSPVGTWGSSVAPSTVYSSRKTPTGTWGSSSSPSTNWSGRAVPPPDGETQTI